MFKRAEWHSGLKYRNKCPLCNTLVEYDDYKLDFRPWFADGFVYCPKCKKPLRHSEHLAVNEKGEYINPTATTINTPVEEHIPSDGTFAYCANCGKRYTKGKSKFCTSCGKELPQE